MRPNVRTQASIQAPCSFANFENIAGMLLHLKFFILTEQVLKPCDFFLHFF